MNALTINVIGTPAPQGSKKGFYNARIGRVQMVESSKKVAPWRQDVVAAVQAVLAVEDWWAIPPGAVRVDVTYYLPRPRYHYRTGARANELKPNAPTYCDKKPDRDKLDRATCDALTSSGVIRDDAQIADGRTVKRYADGPTGARITITPLPVSGLVSVPAAASLTAGTDPHTSDASHVGEAATRPTPHTVQEELL